MAAAPPVPLTAQDINAKAPVAALKTLCAKGGVPLKNGTKKDAIIEALAAAGPLVDWARVARWIQESPTNPSSVYDHEAPKDSDPNYRQYIFQTYIADGVKNGHINIPTGAVVSNHAGLPSREGAPDTPTQGGGEGGSGAGGREDGGGQGGGDGSGQGSGQGSGGAGGREDEGREDGGGQGGGEGSGSDQGSGDAEARENREGAEQEEGQEPVASPQGLPEDVLVLYNFFDEEYTPSNSDPNACSSKDDSDSDNLYLSEGSQDAESISSSMRRQNYRGDGTPELRSDLDPHEWYADHREFVQAHHPARLEVQPRKKTTPKEDRMEGWGPVAVIHPLVDRYTAPGVDDITLYNVAQELRLLYTPGHPTPTARTADVINFAIRRRQTLATSGFVVGKLSSTSFSQVIARVHEDLTFTTYCRYVALEKVTARYRKRNPGIQEDVHFCYVYHLLPDTPPTQRPGQKVVRREPEADVESDASPTESDYDVDNSAVNEDIPANDIPANDAVNEQSTLAQRRFAAVLKWLVEYSGYDDNDVVQELRQIGQEIKHQKITSSVDDLYDYVTTIQEILDLYRADDRADPDGRGRRITQEAVAAFIHWGKAWIGQATSAMRCVRQMGPDRYEEFRRGISYPLGLGTFLVKLQKAAGPAKPAKSATPAGTEEE